MSIQKKIQKKIKKRTHRRVGRVKNAQVKRGVNPRISVFRSLKHIYAQIIDDNLQHTLVSFSSLSLKKEESSDKTDIARAVGLQLGKKALEKSIKKVFFDRGKYLYHGRVKALAEGLREGGLSF